MKTSYLIKATGLNLHHLIEFFEREKLCVSSLNRPLLNTLYFVITKNDFKKLKKSQIFQNYNFSRERVYGGENFLLNLLKRSGLLIGIVAIFLITLNLTNKVMSVEFDTANHTCQNLHMCLFEGENYEKLIKTLEENGVKKGAPLSSLIESRKLEQILMRSFPQISAVTMKREGVRVKINILESKLPASLLAGDLVSPVSGVVLSTEVISGESLVKNGDIVLKGQTLVKASGDIPVTAQITIRTFYHDNMIYNENQIGYVRTGRKTTVHELSFKGRSAAEKPDFSLYEEEKAQRYVFYNLFLPIVSYETTFFELEAVENYVPFEDKEDELKASLEEKVRELIPPEAKEKATTYATFVEGSRVRIDCYIEAYLTIKK